MAKRNREPDGDDTSSAMGRWNTVFIDTNLDTHLAMIVSHSDTVLHLKKKITSEHPKCFPNCGKIKIDALKVKRKGFFYHLSDSMLVKSAFEGAKKCWFLSVDASSIKQPDENQMPNKSKATNQLALICFTKTTSDYTSEKHEELSQRQVALETHIEHREGGSEAGVNDDQCNDPAEASVRSELGVNKKCKSKKKDKTEVSNYTVKDDDMHIDEHSSGKAVAEVPKDTEMQHMDACNIDSEAHAVHKDDDSKVGVAENQCSDALDESLRSGSIASKKWKSKKKTEVSVSNCTLKDDSVDIDEHSSGKTVREVLVDVEVANIDTIKGDVEVNIDAVKGPCSSSLDDSVLRSNVGEFLESRVETRDDKSKNLVCDAQGNAPLEEASKSKPASRKRKMRESKKASNPQEENNNETPMITVVVPESFVIVKPKNTTVAENLTTEFVNLGADATSSGKRKRKGKRKKKISSKDQEVIVEPPSHNPGEERCKEDAKTIAVNVDKENAEFVARDIDKEYDAVIVSEPNVQLAIPSSAVGVGVMEHNDANAEAKSAAPGRGLGSLLKGTKKTKKRQYTNGKELPPPAVTEFGNLREDVLSGDESVLQDNHVVKINGPDKVKEQKELPHNHGKEEMVPEKCEQPIQDGEEGKSKEAVGSTNLAETNINMEPGKSSGSKKLKRAKKPVSAKAILSSTECSANMGGDRLNRNEVELLPLTQVNKNKENEEIMQKNLVKETETSSHVEEKESKMDSLKQNIADITLSDTHKGNSIDRPLEFVDGDVLNNLNVSDANPQEDVLNSKDDGINFKDYFSPREGNREAPPVEPIVNAVKKLKSSDMAVKAKKKILVSLENGSDRKSHPKNSTVIEHKDAKRSTLSSKKEIEQKASWSNNRSTFAKSSSKGVGEVVNSSQHEKSLLATPASIFWDYSSESSEVTDSSKKAQSDNSSSSSDSEEENKSILDPDRNGVDGALGANDGRSEKETKTPLSKRISMDVILRCSSRFKKAKLSAAQSQLEDTESQAFDIDLDSQPNQ